jgi:hypothetical protein
VSLNISTSRCAGFSTFVIFQGCGLGFIPLKGRRGVKGFSPGEAQGLRIKQIHENSIKPKPLLFHKYLIAAKGLLLIDNMYLDELRENLKVSRFLLIVIPLNMEGVTALPVNPIVRI